MKKPTNTDLINSAENLSNWINATNSIGTCQRFMSEKSSFFAFPLFCAYLIYYLSEDKQPLVLRFIEDNTTKPDTTRKASGSYCNY